MATTEIEYPSTGGVLTSISHHCAVIHLGGMPLEVEGEGVSHYLPGRLMKDLVDDVARAERDEAERVKWRRDNGVTSRLPEPVTVRVLPRACLYVSCTNCAALFEDDDCGGMIHLDSLDAGDILRAWEWRQRSDDQLWVCPECVEDQLVEEPYEDPNALLLWDAICEGCGACTQASSAHLCSQANASALTRALLALFLLIPAAGLALQGERTGAAIALWFGLAVLVIAVSALKPSRRRAHGSPILRRVIRWCVK